MVGLDLQLVVQHGARPLATEVPVSVVTQVQHRGRIGLRPIFDAQRAVLPQRVGDADPQCAGVALFSIRAGVGQLHTARVGRRDLPHPFVEAACPAVQAVRPVVAGEAVLPPVQGEAAAGDAVGVAPDDGAEVRAARHVVRERAQAERHVAHPARAVRHLQPLDGGAVGQDGHTQAWGLQHEAAHLGPVVQRAVGI